MQNSVAPPISFQKEKDELGAGLTRTLATAYLDKEIRYEDMQKAADYILNQLELVKNSADMKQFLTNLTIRWGIFHQFVTVAKYDEQKQQEEAVIKKLSGYITSLSSS